MTTKTAPSPARWDEFVDHVLITARHPLGAAWEALLAPDVVHETRRALSDLLADLNQTVRDNKSTMPAHDYKAWLLAKAVPTRTLLEERQREVRRITQELHQEAMGKQTNEGRVLAAKLATAINRHRLATVAAGLDPEPHDRELWAQLHELTVSFYGKPVTLNEMIGEGHWRDDGGVVDA